jgi:phenylacetyl-CoA:acceptor oxidoreductase 26-kDa subunit
MTADLKGCGAPRLQRNWDSRAACNFIGSGSGTGLLVAAAVASLAGWPYYPAGVLAVALIGFGLSMVWLEIGRPLRVLNVFFHPQTSWMTRESFLALPVLALAGLAVLIDQRFVSLPFQAQLPITVLALMAAMIGLGFLYCQARILHASQGIPAWREPTLQAVIIVTGIAEGLGLLLILSLFIGPPLTWVVVASVVAAIARSAAWEYYRRRVELTGPAPAVAVLNQVSLPVHLLGTLLVIIFLVMALRAASPVMPAAIAGFILFAVGAWLKFNVVTRAAFTQGFAIPFVPVRGRISTAVPRHG